MNGTQLLLVFNNALKDCKNRFSKRLPAAANRINGLFHGHVGDLSEESWASRLFIIMFKRNRRHYPCWRRGIIRQKHGSNAYIQKERCTAVTYGQLQWVHAKGGKGLKSDYEFEGRMLLPYIATGANLCDIGRVLIHKETLRFIEIMQLKERGCQWARFLI